MATIRSGKNGLLAISARAILFVFQRESPNDRDNGDGGDEMVLQLLKRIDMAELTPPPNNKKEEPNAKSAAKTKGKGKKSEPANQEEEAKGLEILDACFSEDGSLLSLAVSTKQVLVLDANKDWSLVASIWIPKSPTRLSFDAQGKIIVADRWGSVSRYNVESNEKATNGDGGDDDANEEEQDEEDGEEKGEGEDPSSGTDLLGHFSQLLDFCFSPDGRYILTADRDEKLRISRYPQSYVIEHFCLGHSSYLKSVLCLDGNTAATAGGDAEIRLWDIKSGTCLLVNKSCGGPIRKLGYSPKRRVLIALEESGALRFFDYSGEEGMSLRENEELACQVAADVLVDVIVSEDGSELLALGRKAIYSSRFDGKLAAFAAPSSIAPALAEELSTSTDRVPFTLLFRVTGSNNLEKYQTSKAERIGRKKNKGKKRKHSDNDE